jgi:hypothetical protein
VVWGNTGVTPTRAETLAKCGLLECEKDVRGIARRRYEGHIWGMSHIDNCINSLRRLIATGDANGLPLAKRAIEEYWAATPSRARKSGLLYIQQILHGRRNALNQQSWDFAVVVDAYIEKKLMT